MLGSRKDTLSSFRSFRSGISFDNSLQKCIGSNCTHSHVEPCGQRTKLARAASSRAAAEIDREREREALAGWNNEQTDNSNGMCGRNARFDTGNTHTHLRTIAPYFYSKRRNSFTNQNDDSRQPRIQQINKLLWIWNSSGTDTWSRNGRGGTGTDSGELLISHHNGFQELMLLGIGE